MKLNFLISKLFKLSIGRKSDLHNFYDRLNKISAEGTFEDYFNFFQNFENIYSDTSDN